MRRALFGLVALVAVVSSVSGEVSCAEKCSKDEAACLKGSYGSDWQAWCSSLWQSCYFKCPDKMSQSQAVASPTPAAVLSASLVGGPLCMSKCQSEYQALVGQCYRSLPNMALYSTCIASQNLALAQCTGQCMLTPFAAESTLPKAIERPRSTDGMDGACFQSCESTFSQCIPACAMGDIACQQKCASTSRDCVSSCLVPGAAVVKATATAAAGAVGSASSIVKAATQAQKSVASVASRLAHLKSSRVGAPLWSCDIQYSQCMGACDMGRKGCYLNGPNMCEWFYQRCTVTHYSSDNSCESRKKRCDAGEPNDPISPNFPL